MGEALVFVVLGLVGLAIVITLGIFLVASVLESMGDRAMSYGVVCWRDTCRAKNPAEAQYCGRCGKVIRSRFSESGV